MSTSTASTLTAVDVVMFTVSDVDAARDFYVGVMGFEVRADVRFGEQGENRWLEVAPPGSPARISLNPPMQNQPGGSTVGLTSTDVHAEHARLRAIDGVDVDADVMSPPGAPTLFSLRDPDGNHLWVSSVA